MGIYGNIIEALRLRWRTPELSPWSGEVVSCRHGEAREGGRHQLLGVSLLQRHRPEEYRQARELCDDVLLPGLLTEQQDEDDGRRTEGGTFGNGGKKTVGNGSKKTFGNGSKGGIEKIKN